MRSARALGAAAILFAVFFVVALTGAGAAAASQPAHSAQPVAALTGSVAHLPDAVDAARVSAAVPAIGPDCHGEPPLPASPQGHLGVRPATVSNADPFTTPNVSLASVYGSSYKWFWYDNGCGATDGLAPSIVTNLANFGGLELPGLGPSWGQGLLDLVVDPSSWISVFDQPVAAATTGVANGTWWPWLAVSLCIVAVIVMLRARDGRLTGSITAAVWALLVLTVVTWTIRYPMDSVELLDKGIQTSVTEIANGFDERPGPPVPGTGADTTSAKLALDRSWDSIVRGTLYRAWSEGTFGNPDSATAQKYGPTIFKAVHFSWTEYDTYMKDPNGAGQAIIDAKAESFRQTAEQIKTEDPVAYQFFTGNRLGDRIAVAALTFVAVLAVVLFLLLAGFLIFFSYLVYRVAIPLAPAAGVVFMFENLRATALEALKKVVRPIIMGPVFFLAALLVLRYNRAILESAAPYWLKLVFIAVVTLIVWKILKPVAMMPGAAALSRSSRGFLSTLAAVRFGTPARSKKDDEEEEEQRPGEEPARRRRPASDPVYLPAISATAEPASRPDEAAPSEPIYMHAERVPDPARPGGPQQPYPERPVIRALPAAPAPVSARGVFAPRAPDDLAAASKRTDGGRTARELSLLTAATHARVGEPDPSTAAELHTAVQPHDRPLLAIDRTPAPLDRENHDFSTTGAPAAKFGGPTEAAPEHGGSVDGPEARGPLGTRLNPPTVSGGSEQRGGQAEGGREEPRHRDLNAAITGGLVPQDVTLREVPEANLTYDGSGRQVFVVYSPHGSTAYAQQ